MNKHKLVEWWLNVDKKKPYLIWPIKSGQNHLGYMWRWNKKENDYFPTNFHIALKFDFPKEYEKVMSYFQNKYEERKTLDKEFGLLNSDFA